MNHPFTILQDGVTCGGCRALVKTSSFKRCKDYCNWAYLKKVCPGLPGATLLDHDEQLGTESHGKSRWPIS